MSGSVRQAVIPPEVLTRVGRALYGDQWQMPLARDLGMSDRSLRYMAKGERGIHAGIVADLVAILEARGLEVAAIVKELRRAIR